MKTPELTMDQLYELCELAKTSAPGSLVEVKREELWALVEMAKQQIQYAKETEKWIEVTSKDAARINFLKDELEKLKHRPVPTDENGNARPFGE